MHTFIYYPYELRQGNSEFFDRDDPENCSKLTDSVETLFTGLLYVVGYFESSPCVNLYVLLDYYCSFRDKIVQTYKPDGFKVWRKVWLWNKLGFSISHYRDFSAQYMLLNIYNCITSHDYVKGLQNLFFFFLLLSLLSLLYQHYISWSECGNCNSVANLGHLEVQIAVKWDCL